MVMRKRRLQWYGHVCRREEREGIKRVCNIRVGGKRGKGRPKHRWRDTIKADMKMWNREEEDTDDRIRWRSLIELGAQQQPVTRKD